MKKLVLVILICVMVLGLSPVDKVSTAQAITLPMECDEGFGWDCFWAVVTDWILHGPIGGGLMPPI